MTNFELLIDTDAGVDDMLALFLLLNLVPPSTVDVAVTFGNVPRDQAICNVSLFSRLSGFIPRRILQGRACPLQGEPRFALDVHGEDGLGGVTRRYLGDGIENIAASDLFSIRTVQPYNLIFAIGPLTDIAELAKAGVRAPLFVMGGAFDVPGNISTFAEFNFFSDPQAASEVFEHYSGDVFVVPLDICNRVLLERTYLNNICKKYPSSTSFFLKDIHQHYMNFYKQVEGIDGCHPHDAITVYAAFFRDVIAWDRGRVRIITNDSERGRSVFVRDEDGCHHVARHIDPAGFFDCLENAMAHHLGASS